MAQRAARYRSRAGDTVIDERTEGLLFQRGDARYVITIADLREVRFLKGFCPIPGARDVVPGIIYYRGEILSLHDLGAFMGASSEDEGRWIIVVQHEGQRLGLMADDILGVRAYTADDIHPPPITMGSRAGCVRGVLEDGVLAISADALFSDPAFFKGL